MPLLNRPVLLRAAYLMRFQANVLLPKRQKKVKKKKYRYKFRHLLLRVPAAGQEQVVLSKVTHKLISIV